jgi:hypothetical protein
VHPFSGISNLFFPFWGERTVQFLARFEVHLRGFCFLFFPSLFAELAVGGEIVIFRRGELESVVFDETMMMCLRRNNMCAMSQFTGNVSTDV